MRPSRRDVRRRLSRTSLVTRVTAAAALVVTAGLGCGALLLVVDLRVTLIAGIDEAARDRADQVAAGPLTGTLAPGDESVQVVADDGTVLAATADLLGGAPLVAAPEMAAPERVLDEVATPLGNRRVLVRRLGSSPSDPVVLVASSTREFRKAVARLALLLAVAVPVLVGVLVLLVRAAVAWALRVVDTLRREVDGIGASDLHLRVRPPAAQDELHALAVTMNELLGRLEGAVAGQRRFVADAAHELRSPLAGLRTQLEVAARSDDPGAWAIARPRMLATTARLAELVDDLVALARLDDGGVTRRDLVDLDELVLTEVEARRAAGAPVWLALLEATRVVGDPVALRRVVANLLDNAARHARTAVTVRLSDADGQARFEVADDGDGVPPAERDRVFDRFHRLDEARARDAGGSGLGLAIVRQAVLQHGGDVVVDDVVGDAGPGAVFTVSLPLAAEQD